MVAQILNFSAGSLNSQEEPISVAMQELEEELGLQITKAHLHLLNEEPLIVAPSI